MYCSIIHSCLSMEEPLKLSVRIGSPEQALSVVDKIVELSSQSSFGDSNAKSYDNILLVCTYFQGHPLKYSLFQINV